MKVISHFLTIFILIFTVLGTLLYQCLPRARIRRKILHDLEGYLVVLALPHAALTRAYNGNRGLRRPATHHRKPARLC